MKAKLFSQHMKVIKIAVKQAENITLCLQHISVILPRIILHKKT